MENKKIIFFSALLVTLILGMVGIYSFFSQERKNEERPDTEEVSFYKELVSSNKDFALGENLYNSSDYENAISSYEVALKEVRTPAEEAQVSYKLALAHRFSNQPLVAIPLFKEIASNLDYPATTRAYAVQAIGQAHYSFNDSAVDEEIFRDSPYKEMYVAEDKELSYRRLFEYASSLYPLGVPETRIAYWYGEQMVRDKRSGLQSNESYKDIIKAKLANADADIQRTRTNPERGAGYIPEILTRKAYVLGLVSIAGDESLGNPEQAFEAALAEAKGSATYEAQAKYHYALYQAQKYGADRSNEIQTLLQEFYNSNRFNNTGIVRFMRNEKDNRAGRKSDIEALAAIDPKFRAYLISDLGW